MVYSAPMCTYLGLSSGLCNMLFEVIFPWILSFAIIYGLLELSKPFGTTGGRINGIVALVLGFFVTAFNPWRGSIGAFFTVASGTIMMFLVAILGLILVASLAGWNFFKEWRDHSGGKGFIVLIVLIFIAWLLLSGWLGGGLSVYSMFKQDTMALIVLVAVIAAMWWFVGAGSKEQTKS